MYRIHAIVEATVFDDRTAPSQIVRRQGKAAASATDAAAFPVNGSITR
jgi:hypothetical protein